MKKRKFPYIVLLWFTAVILFATILTSCSTQKNIVLETIDENESPLLTQSMQNIMSLIRTCEEMEQQFLIDIENECANEEDFHKYITNVDYMRNLLWEIAYVDYIIHESTE